MLDRHQQVFHALLGDVEIHVAGDPEGKAVEDFAAGEKLRQLTFNQILKQHEGRSRRRVDRLDEARQHAGNLDEGEHLALVRQPQTYRQLDRAVAEHRERMARIDRQRRQYRQHFDLKITRQFPPAGFREFGDPAQPDPVAFQFRQQFGRQNPMLALQQLVKPGADSEQLFFRREPRIVGGGVAELQQLAQSGHANHEELVEIAAEDGDEFQPFQHRDFIAGGFVQHPGVEIKPAQFPAQHDFRAVICRIFDHGSVRLAKISGLIHDDRAVEKQIDVGSLIVIAQGVFNGRTQHVEQFGLLLGRQSHLVTLPAAVIQNHENPVGLTDAGQHHLKLRKAAVNAHDQIQRVRQLRQHDAFAHFVAEPDNHRQPGVDAETLAAQHHHGVGIDHKIRLAVAEKSPGHPLFDAQLQGVRQDAFDRGVGDVGNAFDLFPDLRRIDCKKVVAAGVQSHEAKQFGPIFRTLAPIAGALDGDVVEGEPGVAVKKLAVEPEQQESDRDQQQQQRRQHNDPAPEFPALLPLNRCVAGRIVFAASRRHSRAECPLHPRAQSSINTVSSQEGLCHSAMEKITPKKPAARRRLPFPAECRAVVCPGAGKTGRNSGRRLDKIFLCFMFITG
ncbi:hypothetical protein SDC9_78070 [bioreactor metagenome]|uniref:Uncharacterized protein n=1 Tax=bioreactor metagenome TaxID=1076179 RepID=A0A644YSF1_9ZZZZ